MVVTFFLKFVHIREVVFRQLQNNGKQDEDLRNDGVEGEFLKSCNFLLVSFDEGVSRNVGTRREFVKVDLKHPISGVRVELRSEPHHLEVLFVRSIVDKAR